MSGRYPINTADIGIPVVLQLDQAGIAVVHDGHAGQNVCGFQPLLFIALWQIST